MRICPGANRRDDKDRAARALQDPRGDSADQEIVERSVAMRPHDDEVCPEPFGFLQDLVRMGTLDMQARGLDPGACELLFPLLEFLVFRSKIARNSHPDALRPRLVADEVRVRIGNVQKGDVRAKRLCEARSSFDHRRGNIGEVERNQNRFGIHKW